MAVPEILLPSNLMSLSRVFMIPAVWYFMARPGETASWICVGIMILAAVTDGLDGYIARKMGTVSRLGIALDPIADKIFAGALVLLLITYRDFPIWLAGVIIGRDLLILAVGAALLRGRKISLPSNLTGKYAFTAIAMLIGSYVKHYEFGIMMSTAVMLPLLALSVIGYARVALTIRAGGTPQPFADRPIYKWLRTAFGWSFGLIYFGLLAWELW